MRALLVINATITSSMETLIHKGRFPRKDYLDLRRALRADVIDLEELERRMWTRFVQWVLGANLAQALLAWSLSGRYDVVFADRETTGLLLAALSRLRRHRPRLVMIGHLLSPPKKQLFFRLFRLRKSVSCVIVHSSVQQRVALESLGLHSEQVALVPYQCDELFWSPRDTPSKNQICSAGLEFRDYDTLVEAVAGLNVNVVIAAASHWSTHHTRIQTPPHVRVASFGYEDLRQLYAESLFVVVPLRDVDNQAGITVILEAMAMGKAVVVSHARGQVDVIRDRRRLNRSDPSRQTQPDWVGKLGASEHIAQGQTGMYVMPGDATELRRAISFLLEHPDHARTMGANGRHVIESTMRLDQYTERLTSLIIDDKSDSGVLSRSSSDVDATSINTI